MSEKKNIFFVLFCILLDILGIGLIIPVLPQLVGDLAQDQTAQTWWLGAMLVSYGSMQFLFAPLLGAISDRFGRRPVLLLGIFGLGMMFLVPALSSSLPVILLSRVLGGTCSANIAVAQAYIADVTPKEKRAEAFGMMGACFGIGFILGPMIGGILGETDVRLPFMLSAVLACVNFLYGLFILPESLAESNRKSITLSECNPLSVLSNLFKIKSVGLLIAVMAIASFCQSVMHSTWTIYTNIRYDWTPMSIGFSMVAIGVVSVFMQGFAMRRFLALMGERLLIIAGLLSGATAYVAFGLTYAGWVTYIIILLNFLSVAVAPTLSGKISRSVAPHEQGVTMGAVTALNSVMCILAPLIGTPLLVHTVHQNDHSILAGLIYFICGALMLIGSAIAARHFRQE